MKKSYIIKQIGLNLLLSILAVLVIYPFVLVVSVSLSNEIDIMNFGYRLIPVKFDTAAYKYIFSNPGEVINAYKVTGIFSVVSTALSVFLMSCMAYMLSKRDLKGKAVISFLIYFTTLFSGGLVPTYILNTQYLHLGDTMWIYIIPGLISPFYVFMMRSFIQDIPYEITESAVIDGANEYMIYFRMILPLIKPALATVALMTFLAKWNDWYTSMLYINNQDLISLQYLLQKMMMNIELIRNNSETLNFDIGAADIPAETARMAMVVIVAGPALVVFPFFQKYFAKGLTVGSVKG